MDMTPYIAPPGRLVETWFAYRDAEGKTFMDAANALMKKVQSEFPGANWIVSFVVQQTPETTIASGIAVIAN